MYKVTQKRLDTFVKHMLDDQTLRVCQALNLNYVKLKNVTFMWIQTSVWFFKQLCNVNSQI